MLAVTSARALRSIRRGMVFGGLCYLMLAAPACLSEDSGAPASNAGGQVISADELLDFDIPAQSLAAALNQYAAASDRPTLFRAEMVAGRTSAAVHGRHTPEAALHLMLEGTGLVAARVDGGPADALVLREVSAAVGHLRLDPAGVDMDYGAWVQARVWEALCSDALTAPGEYRLLLRFNIDSDGQIQHARLLGTTGDIQRDTAVLAMLDRVHVGRVPPADMAQPLTMIVLPRDLENPGSGPRCDADSTG